MQDKRRKERQHPTRMPNTPSFRRMAKRRKLTRLLPQSRARDPSCEFSRRTSLALTQECANLAFRVTLGGRPASEHEGNLVHKVGNVVDHIEEGLVNCSKQVAEQVAKWVDGPSNCDDQAHVVEG